MLFNSIEFALFLPVVFIIYWAIGYAKIDGSLKLKMQNAFVVVASYIFYGWWIYYLLIAAIWWYAPSFSTDFIYFQF